MQNCAVAKDFCHFLIVQMTLFKNDTLGANKKFTFHLRSTVVLWCDYSSKNGRKLLLRKRIIQCLYIFRTVVVLERL